MILVEYVINRIAEIVETETKDHISHFTKVVIQCVYLYLCVYVLTVNILFTGKCGLVVEPLS